MRFTTRVGAALLLVGALPGALAAQQRGSAAGGATGTPQNPVQVPVNNTAFGGSSAEFLLLGAGARGMALGGAYATIANDVSALYYNPAGLPLMGQAQANVTIMPYIANTNYYWTGLAFPFSDGDFGMGVQLGHFGFGNQPVYTTADPDNTSGDTYGVDENYVGISFAHAFIERFTAGFTLKFVNDNLASGLGGATGRAFALDFGTNFHTELGGNPLHMSFVVQNLGSNIRHQGHALDFRQFGSGGNADAGQRLDPTLAQFQASSFPLPRLFRVGLAYDPVSTETTRLSLMGEFVEANQMPVTGGGGAELHWQSAESPIGASLRASYELQPDERNLGTYQPSNTWADGISVGGGLSYAIQDQYKLAFDYTYRNFGGLGNVDVFSVSFGW